MDASLESFLRLTEGQTTSLAAPTSKEIVYPFLYVTRLSTVELEFWINRKILFRAPQTDEDISLYLKTNSGYKLLGYLCMSYDTLLSLIYLKQQTIMLKISKTQEYDVFSTMFEHYLLL